MDRATSSRPSERRAFDSRSPAGHAQPFPPPNAQPPMQLPYSDPFQPTRDPFLLGARDRRGSQSLQGRAWPSPQANGGQSQTPNHALPPPPPPPPPQPALLPPAHPHNGAIMSLPFDPSRRRSLGGSSPSQYPQRPCPSRPPTEEPSSPSVLEPLEPPPIPPSFQSRQMPPPSSPQIPPGQRGPPTASPFAGARDLASFASRSSGGMSISSILGNTDERKVPTSPQSQAAAASYNPRFIRPPSPGRARASSMREGYNRGFREMSPPRHLFGDARPASSAPTHERTASEQSRKAGMFGSPQFHRNPSQHSFRAFQPPQHDGPAGGNARGAPMRPSSQPSEPGPTRNLDDIIRRDGPQEGGLSGFRHFEPPRSEAMFRHEQPPFSNGPTSQPTERGVFSSPAVDMDYRQENPLRIRPSHFGTPLREDQAGSFRPSLGSGVESAQDSVEMRHFRDLQREAPRGSPPLTDVAPFERLQDGFADRPMTWEEHLRMEARPMTWEEHQRMEAISRELQQRKESEGSMHRALLNISPELSRKGRNSPLPQAVQGAQPRHVGPGGNSGVKMEFGRMFSGLGSGVGSATPTAGQSVNGTTTPSRLSPVQSGDLVRTAVAEIEDNKGSIRGRGRGGRKPGRRPREDEEKVNGVGRETPDAQRGNKRAKPNHHHHHHVHPHHHHHHHHEPTNGPSPFNTLRFPSNPLSHSGAPSNPAHHHHHHAHPGHHHHHAPRSAPAPRKPTTTVMSRRLVEECASKPRKHLGSQLYTTELSSVPVANSLSDLKIKFSSKMKAIPVFAGQENSTYTVRVPRRYLAPADDSANSGALEEICRRRQLWGTDVYTDDTDVVAAAVHSGWIRGDFGEFNADLQDLCANESEQEDEGETPLTLAVRPRKPIRVPVDYDAHVTLLILPPLNNYASTSQHHVRSREWAGTHDGMSFMIHRIEFVQESAGTRYLARGGKARKARMAAEEAKRREAAAGLLMFAKGGSGGNGGAVRVGA